MTTHEITLAVWATILELVGMTAGDMLKIAAAIAAGKTTIIDLGNGAAEVTFRSIDDTHDAVVAQMSGSTRTDVLLDP